MDGFPSKSLPAIFVCLLLANALGCAGKTYKIGKTTIWPIGGPVSDDVPGITPPRERIKQLQQQAKDASVATPDQQERLAADLALQFEKESDPLIRIEMLRTMAKYRTVTAAATLRKALSDSNPDVRIAACQAWGERGGKDATAALSETLGRDADLDVRLAAARALGETRDQAAVAALGLALEDSDPAMQARAVSSLRQVTGNDFGNDVTAWRQYVKGEVPQNRPVSFAERLRHLF